MARIGTAYVEIKPDLKGFSRSLERGTRGGALFSPLTKGAAVAGLAIGAGLVVEAKRAVQAFTETEKVGKQTAAVLKSTGGRANLTAKQIGNLATALSKKTGFDDEAIQSSENLLLTFRNVRNETGKGNKVFDKASGLIADMSVGLGQDLKSSSIQLGKALNDPARGMLALGRAGITFNEQQRDQIKTLTKSGKTLEAQKIILREVEKQFGGSAAAQAQNTDRLKVSVGNLEEALGSGLKPVVDDIAGSLTGLADRALPEVQEVADAVGKTFERKDIDLGDKITISADKVQNAAAPLIAQLQAELGDADLGPKLQEAFEKGVPMLIDAAAASAPRAAGAFVNAFKNAGPWGQLLTAAFLAQKLGAFNAAGSAASGLFVKSLKKALGGPLARALRAGGETAAANAAEGLASHLPASVEARQGRLNKTFSKSGKLAGRAFGIAALAAVALLIKELIDKYNEAAPEKPIGGKVKGVPVRSTGGVRDFKPAVKGPAQKIADKLNLSPQRKIKHLKVPTPRKRLADPHSPGGRTFGTRSSVNINVTTPVSDPTAIAHKVNRLQGRTIRRGG